MVSAVDRNGIDGPQWYVGSAFMIKKLQLAITHLLRSVVSEHWALLMIQSPHIIAKHSTRYATRQAQVGRE
jgi:hypothetical protein